MWSREIIPRMGPFIQFDQLSAFFDELAGKGRIEKPDVREAFAAFNVVDTSGRFVAPVIVEQKTDKLYSLLLALSQKLSEAVSHSLPVEELERRFGLRNREEALVVCYHELMWELLGYFEAQGLIHRPPAFISPREAAARDIGDLVFLVRSRDKSTSSPK